MELVLSIGHVLMTAVLPGLATLAGGLLIGLLKKQLTRAGIDLTEKQDEQLRRLVENSIVQVEEVARRRN